MPNGNDFASFVQWGFYATLCGSLAYAVAILGKLRESVEALNMSVAQLLERDRWREKEIEDLSSRVRALETGG